ncbi:uncharacterized protein LOC127102712 [Lathyrus oleraceus]|uniref:uncharacterized protein LOC127102712 n=1 Tax=Pisum sativum TaxID=3888 RepID=UPI0021CF860B|nr:uncharacterized protein LOC127102712 [Pisum sativum]
MVAFLKYMENKTWKAIIRGWKHPVVNGKDGKATTKLKPEEGWSKEENELALGNSKDLNALFNGVDKNIFRLINTFTIAKEAWEILKTTHEGTPKVKMYKLQLLTTRFENLKMKDDENIHDFHMSILEIANSYSALRERMSEEKLVRKILRSLPTKFDMNVTTIEEAQDIISIRVDELIESLHTFELGINDRTEKKTKSITFVSNTEDEQKQCDLDTDEGMTNAIVFLGRQFNKVLKRIDMKSRPNVKNIPLDIRNTNDFHRRTRTEERSNQGFGHIRAECPTYLKKLKKILYISWSDEDNSESELEEEVYKHVTALIGIWESDEDSCDEELFYEELVAAYRELCIRSEEVCLLGEKQKKIISQLQAEKEGFQFTISELQNEVILLSSKLNNMTKSVRMLNKGSNMLGEVLQIGKAAGYLRGIGFKNQSLHIQGESSMTNFSLPGKESKLVMSKSLSQHHAVIETFKLKEDHLAGDVTTMENMAILSLYVSYCLVIQGTQHNSGYPTQLRVNQKKEWIPKTVNTRFIAHTSRRVSAREDWYFDSGYSRNMTGVKKFLENIKPYSIGHVTFGYGAKGEIKGVGRLACTGLPSLDNVLLCLVINEKNQVLMKGVRSNDNYYLWSSKQTNLTSTCLISKEDEVNLWHQKLGHLHLKGMKKIMSQEVIREIPKLKIKEGKICGECKTGKQTKMSHPKLQYQTTSKVLELLHMDLMGPMQVESLGGKRYTYVVVDDFSRFTWVNFIKEKYDVFEVLKYLCKRIEREKEIEIIRIRSDHGKEFENNRFANFFSSKGIGHEFSSPITPHQNGVVEHKNKTLQESTRVMFHTKRLPYHFWAEAMNITCYIHNRVTLRTDTSATLYEL